ncbi:MAG TPA: hypothetical protein VFA65_00345 [Bryobacteraceae bacterium]|nr:hypothetical protein [Bryobacteraceae bacterium]
MAVNAQNPDAGGNPVVYAYKPSIINTDGPWRMYFCSNGSSLPSGGADAVREVISDDGVNWTTPQIVLQVSNATYERSACDSSVVKFDAGDGLYYYLYYTGGTLFCGPNHSIIYNCDPNDQNTINNSVVFVARSTSPDGPFAKYTTSGTWEVDAASPMPIIMPQTPTSGSYGAGSQSVVVSPSGTLYMWYDDLTISGADHIYRVQSTDGVNWSQFTPTNISYPMGDVKWDTVRQQFIWFIVYYHLPGDGSPLQPDSSYAAFKTSSDFGVTWSDDLVINPPASFPVYSAAGGISGDNHGWIMVGDTYLLFKAPYDSSTYVSACNGNLTSPNCGPNGDIYGGKVVGWPF